MNVRRSQARDCTVVRSGVPIRVLGGADERALPYRPMHRLFSFLAFLTLTGCAVAPDADVNDSDDSELTGTSSAAYTVPGVTLPKVDIIQPLPTVPRPPPSVVLDPILPLVCTTNQNRFSVLTRSCAPFRAAKGYFSARPVFTSAQGTLCEMQWHPDQATKVALLPYASLVQIAERDPARGDEPAIVELCDATSVCDPGASSCRRLAGEPTRPKSLTGMGGCTSCAYVDGSTLYAVLPPDYANGTITIDVGDSCLSFSPRGVQTFSADVSSIPTRTSGFVNVNR